MRRAVEYYRDCFVHKSFSMESNNGALSCLHYLAPYNGRLIRGARDLSYILVRYFSISTYSVFSPVILRSKYEIPDSSRDFVAI